MLLFTHHDVSGRHRVALLKYRGVRGGETNCDTEIINQSEGQH